MYGAASVNSGSNRVVGWIKVSSQDLPNIGKGTLSHPPAEMPGLSDLPTVTSTVTNGACKSAVLPLRKHQRSRWLLLDLHTAAADFSEEIDSYLLYFEWTPNTLTTPTAVSPTSLPTPTQYSRMTSGDSTNDFLLQNTIMVQIGSIWRQGNSSWTTRTFDLSSVAANKSNFTFRFWTSTSNNPSTATAYVDDVKVIYSNYTASSSIYPHEYPNPAPILSHLSIQPQ